MTLTLLSQIETAAKQLDDAGVFFGHGTTNAFDEAAWLVLWKLGLDLDADLDGEVGGKILSANEQASINALITERIQTRKPAAYLTQQAWLQGVPFYIDERSIVPRSLIAELIADGTLDAWLSEKTRNVLDVCTGNGSLAVLCALAWPEVHVDAVDISTQALEVAAINIAQHEMQTRIALIASKLANRPSWAHSLAYDRALILAMRCILVTLSKSRTLRLPTAQRPTILPT